MTDELVWGVALAVVTAIVVWLYLRRVDAAAPRLYGVGAGSMALGILWGGAARVIVPADSRWPSVAGAVVATGGLCLATSTVQDSWRQMLADTMLISVAPFVAVYTALLVVQGAPDTAHNNIDALCAALAWFFAALLVGLSRRIVFPTRIERVLLASFGLLWAASWTVVALPSIGVAAAPDAVAQALMVAGWVSLAALLVRLMRQGVVPVRQPLDHGTGGWVYAFAGVAASVVMVGLLVEPGIIRSSLVILVGVSVLTMLLRITVTITDLEDANATMREREHHFRTLVQDSSDVILIGDDAGLVRYCSPASQHVFGPGQYEGAALEDVLGLPADALARVSERDPADGPLVIEGTRGEQVIEAAIAVRGDRLVISARDVTERDQLRRTLHRMAYHDPLTGLPNRVQMLDTLNRELAAAATAGASVAVLFVDLDRFKHINDASGHATGDDVLRQVAVRLLAECDGLTLARLGGDEFVVVRTGGATGATALAHRITTGLEQPFIADGRTFRIGASVGIAMSAPGVGADEMLRRADTAMYQAKATATDYAHYSPEMTAAATARVDRDAVIAEALRRGAIAMYLQPLVRTHRRNVFACEALLRWTLPDGTVCGPDDMLEFAERTGQMLTLTRWITRQAVMRLARTPDSWRSIGVNVPPSVIVEPGWDDEVAALLHDHGVAPRRLVLEITEDAMLAHGAESLAAVAALRARGVRVVLDDFGTGYSSLAYLTRFAVDGVKIDRSFTAELTRSRAARAVVKAVVTVTNELAVPLVVEGVETRAQHDQLCELGVAGAQGFWYARPEDDASLTALDTLGDWRSGSADEAANGG